MNIIVENTDFNNEDITDVLNVSHVAFNGVTIDEDNCRVFVNFDTIVYTDDRMIIGDDSERFLALSFPLEYNDEDLGDTDPEDFFFKFKSIESRGLIYTNIDNRLAISCFRRSELDFDNDICNDFYIYAADIVEAIVKKPEDEYKDVSIINFQLDDFAKVMDVLHRLTSTNVNEIEAFDFDEINHLVYMDNATIKRSSGSILTKVKNIFCTDIDENVKKITAIIDNYHLTFSDDAETPDEVHDYYTVLPLIMEIDSVNPNNFDDGVLLKDEKELGAAISKLEDDVYLCKDIVPVNYSINTAIPSTDFCFTYGNRNDLDDITCILVSSGQYSTLYNCIADYVRYGGNMKSVVED